MHVLWLTDLHFDHARPERVDVLLEDVRARAASILLIGGDVGEAPNFAGFLERLAATDASVYFVLGNHDYYRGSIEAVRSVARGLESRFKNLCWLPDAGVVSITDETALVGHGGWGDARAGNFLRSTVLLNDYFVIEELRELSQSDWTSSPIPPPPTAVLTARLKARLHELGDEAAEHFRRVVPEALDAHRRVIVLMHVPPYLEACWHEGRLSDDDWAPHFTCLAAGIALTEIMRERPDREMTVLCGHTHSGGRAQILPNLEVVTGAAVYGQPAVTEAFDL